MNEGTLWNVNGSASTFRAPLGLVTTIPMFTGTTPRMLVVIVLESTTVVFS